MSWSVGQVAKEAGVTVRTLHHYDEIGLLTPSERTNTGYRRYSYVDLERLQRILAYRQLGFGLEEIAAILDDSSVDPIDHLRRQHALLTGKIEELQQMVAAVEKTMEARKMGVSLNPQEMFEVFGENDPTQYEDEVRDRWGDTDAYRQSQRRTATYTKDDWLAIKEEAAGNLADFQRLFLAGVPADSPDAMDVAEAHRQHITRWFYDCGYDIHRGLGTMYVEDERFTRHYDTEKPGLATYVRDAIHANATRAGK
ncbi:MerR family transcriptional regulator [Cryptosporangium arvum]|uniref:Putative transcriptional regulator n=1 Tax=Cryptosporangium arvum DSM 44712 TaxID=927661 RepID=A0A010ZQ79_9ACTN|nr:MerR family transcriptional regulator [Cryptosporangium arvum]EXG79352.1 putative transcriptional regulator [Cryptosporangium arvum DSM 44712]